MLTRDAAGKAIQRGVCTLPDGRELSLTVNDEKGASTPEGDFRVFAGLRSDPFYLAWIVATLKKVPNLLQHDNVLCIVVEFDTRCVLDPAKGSLFGAIAETVPIPQPPDRARISVAPHRLGRTPRADEHAAQQSRNARGSTICATCGISRRRFAISETLQPLFLQRLKDSFADWDMLDGKADWTPEALAANANVFLDDFLLFDVAKPITDQSHLEIEKSTINGQPYQTGGGRTIDANVIDILLTWLVNRDREFLQGGATGATKPGMKVFPYFATPNTEVQTVAESVELAAAPDDGVVADRPVQSPLASGGRTSQLDRRGHAVSSGESKRATAGKSSNASRTSTTRSGSIATRWSPGCPASHYAGTIEVKPKGERLRRRLARGLPWPTISPTLSCGPWSRHCSRQVSEV